MGEIQWIKTSVTIFEDEKIKIIETMPEADTIILVWIKILALAGKINDDGKIYLTKEIPYTPDTLSIVFNRPKSIVILAMETFLKFGMIQMDNVGNVSVTKWAKWQNITGLERIRELTNERVRRHRERKKQEHQEQIKHESTEIKALPVTFCNAVDKIRLDKIRIEKKDISSDLDKSSPEPPVKHKVLDIFYNKETEMFENITDKDQEDWQIAYPACDIEREYYKMFLWLKANPTKAAKRNWRRFITNWLNRTQEKGGTK